MVATFDTTTLNKVSEETQADRYAVSVEEYIKFKRNGFLVVRNLVSPEDIAELRQHTEELMQGRLPEQRHQMNAGTTPQSGTATQGLEAPPRICLPKKKCSISCVSTCCTGS